MDWVVYGQAGLVVLAAGAGFWLWSLVRNDVSIVDSLWSLMFLLIALTCFVLGGAGLDGSGGARAGLVLGLVAIWSLRLSGYITLRNHGQPEDYRYQQIRERNQPHFRFKSLYLVFWLQAGLAWVIAMPLAVAIGSETPLGWLDLLAFALWMIGMVFEVGGDTQLAAFKRDPANAGQVLDTGLWRYTRHPNYFGEFALWWGYFLFAVAAGGWWTLASPLLMSFLLLKVSGVALLEKDIGERRPDYADYIRRTNAFFPGPPRARAANAASPTSGA